MSFLPTTPYDFPSVLLAQAIDGELSTASLNANTMTPLERDTVSQKVTKAIGWDQDPFLSSIVDTVLNPWVLLMAGSSMIGGFRLPGAGKLFHGMESTSAFVRKHGGIAQTLRLLSPAQMLRGTFIESALMQADNEIRTVSNEVAARLSPVFDDLAKRLGLTKGLATDTPLAKEAGTLLHIKLAGLDREVTRRAWKGNKVITKTSKPLVDAEIVDARIAELGLEPAVEAFRNELVQARKMLFGKDGVQNFELDGSKIWKLQRNLRDGVFRGHTGKVMEGILGEDLASKAFASGASRQEFLEAVAQRFGQGFDESFYMPRNQWVARDLAGRLVPPEVRLTQRQGATLATTNAAAVRTRTEALYDVDALERLRPYARDHTAIDDMIEKGKQARHIAQEKGKDMVRYDDINFEPSFVRYMNDAIRSRALFLTTPGRTTLEEMKRSLPVVRDTIKRGEHYIPSEEVAPRFRWTSETGTREKSILEALDEADAPIGGWSVADAIWQGHQLINDRVAQNTLAELFVPTLLGQVGPRGGLMMAAQLHAQTAAKNIIRVLGSTMDEVGPFGQSIRRRLEEFADKDITLARGAGRTGSIAGYLYSTHLGFNLGSATLNLMQPVISTGRFVEVPYLLQGYKEALSTMGRYMTGRAGVKKAFLTPAEKWEIMTKAAPIDVLEDAGIGPSALELIDAVGFSGSNLRPAAGLLDKAVEGSLKLFEKTEWLNRLTTVYAQRAKQAAQGLNVADDIARQEVKSLVSETQFGGHWLNTPSAFLDPGSPLSNPLLRQFASFPLRMVTLTTNVAPHIGGPNVALNVLRDTIRGLGLSAFVYEMGKSTLGPGIERGLYAGTYSDLINNPPIPPAVDIPLKALQAMSQGDAELLKKELPRLFPGGVAASRALSMAPDLSSTPFGALQRQYVDWNQRAPTGEVPLFKADGTLIEWVDPVSLVGRKIGLSRDDTTPQQRDKWLLNQRDQILQYRREAVKALINNDSAKVSQISAEFQKRFGFELTVTQDQVRDFQRLQAAPRTDRILERLPVAARPVYAEAVGTKMQMQTGIPKELWHDSFQRRRVSEATYIQPVVEQAPPFTPFTPF